MAKQRQGSIRVNGFLTDRLYVVNRATGSPSFDPQKDVISIGRSSENAAQIRVDPFLEIMQRNSGEGIDSLLQIFRVVTPS